MNSKPWVIAALVAFGWCHPPAHADEPTVPDYAQRIVEGKSPVAESTITQTGCCDGGAPMITQPIGGGGCATCGGGGGSGECGNGCPTGKCKPGRRCGTCYGDFERPDECSGKCARLFGSMFDCLCCPDPCYEPCWQPVANAAFFQDAARPHSQMRVRWDAGYNLTMPDRNEYFWAKTGGTGKGPSQIESSVDYHELTYYTEAATGAFGFFIEVPYRMVAPDINDFHAGFGDMNIGTKSMFLDCELMQATFQFKTFIPMGNFSKGLGTGHVSLEPALLGTLKLTPKTYMQGEFAEWIPIGGDQDWAGMLMHYHLSVNHLLCCKGAYQFIGNVEWSGYTFQDGRVTNAPGWVPQDSKSSGESIFYLGPGMRLVYCDRFDAGIGLAFALSEDHFADQLYRTEFRIRW